MAKPQAVKTGAGAPSKYQQITVRSTVDHMFNLGVLEPKGELHYWKEKGEVRTVPLTKEVERAIEDHFLEVVDKKDLENEVPGEGNPDES